MPFLYIYIGNNGEIKLIELLNYKILYAEDTYITRIQISTELKKRFSVVNIASNGKEALDLYVKEKPDIILTDIKMPILSGDKFIKEVRYTYKDNKTPIIVISAYEKEFFELENLNVDKFIIKPITELSLIYNIFEVLNIPY